MQNRLFHRIVCCLGKMILRQYRTKICTQMACKAVRRALCSVSLGCVETKSDTCLFGKIHDFPRKNTA